MIARTHLAFGFLIALLISPLIHVSSITNKLIFISLTLISSILPDIDQPNSKISRNIPIISQIVSILSKHRGIFHSLFIAFLISAAIFFLISPLFGIAILIGYLSHLLIDGFTKTGVNFLHPFGHLHLSGFIETGTYSETVVFILIIAAIILKVF